MKSESYALQFLDQKYALGKMFFDNEIEKAISGKEYVLHYLYAHEGPVFPKDLCKKLLTSTARIAAIIRSLEKERLIEIAEDPVDGRRRALRLTESGRRHAEYLHGKKYRLIESVFSRLSEAEIAEYLRLTRRIVSVCEEIRAQNEEAPD